MCATFFGGRGYKAFEDNLNEWGFSVVAMDEDFHIWFHAKFQRDYPEMSGSIRQGLTSTSSMEDGQEPDATTAILGSISRGDEMAAVDSNALMEDHDQEDDDEPPPGYPLTFLQKLRAALSDDLNGDILCWNPDGTGFAMQYGDPRFKHDILNAIFGAITYDLLTNELVSYGFSMVSHIPGRSSIWQCGDLFQRDVPDLDEDVYMNRVGKGPSHSAGAVKKRSGSRSGGKSPRPSSSTGTAKNDNVRCTYTSPVLLHTTYGKSNQNAFSHPAPTSTRSLAPPRPSPRPKKQLMQAKHSPGPAKKRTKIVKHQSPASRKHPTGGRSGVRTTQAIKKLNKEAGGEHNKEASLAAALLRGVTMRPSGKWQAQLYFAGRSRYIGVFPSQAAAALAHEIFRNNIKQYNDDTRMSLQEREDAVNAARKEAYDGVNEKM